jgi:hypothetical protein
VAPDSGGFLPTEIVHAPPDEHLTRIEHIPKTRAAQKQDCPDLQVREETPTKMRTNNSSEVRKIYPFHFRKPSKNAVTKGEDFGSQHRADSQQFD